MTKLLENEHLPYFAEKGIPSNVLMGHFPLEYENLLVRVNVELDGKVHSYSPEQQKKLMDKLYNFNKPYLAVLSGQYYDDIPQQVALFTCLRSIEQDMQKNSFYWHQITGGKSDKLRDDNAYGQVVSSGRLLVLSGITNNCSFVKLEKLRDLLTEYSHLPRIVVLCGTDPLSFCFKQLYVKPSIIAYFGSKTKEET